MRTSDGHFRRIDQLFGAMLDGTSTDADWSELSELLAGDPAAQDHYLALVALHTELAWAHEQVPPGLDELALAGPASAVRAQLSADDDAGQCSTSAPSRFAPHSSFQTLIRQHNFAVAIAIAFVAIGSLVMWMAFSYLPGVANNNDKPAAEAKDEVVAWLMGVHDIQWTAGGKPQGTRLKPGQRLAINQGSIEIQYHTGAEVVIEGPAEFVVGAKDEDTSNSGFLKLGKLVAQCTTKASKGFTVATPTGRVADLGTEFSVDVDQQGDARCHVFEGRVRVSGAMNPALDRELAAGQGIAWNSTGAVRPLSQPVGKRYAAAVRVLRREDAGSIVSDLEPGLVLKRFDARAPRLIYPGIETKIVDAPAALVGLAAIVPPRGAGHGKPGAGYRFQISEPAQLYLLVHNRGDHALDGWQRTDDTVTWTIAGQTITDTVYTRVVEPGEVDVPAHAWQNAESLYGVPHVCVVELLPADASKPSVDTEDTSKEPLQGTTQ